MTQDARVYSMIVEHDPAVPMIQQIDQIMDALLDSVHSGPEDRRAGSLGSLIICLISGL